MITTIRASKRIALGGFLGTGLLFICLLAVKDMNDKLGVMTASNSGYQKMTDSQADKIAIIRTIWWFTHMATCIFIILNAIANHGWNLI